MRSYGCLLVLSVLVLGSCTSEKGPPAAPAPAPVTAPAPGGVVGTVPAPIPAPAVPIAQPQVPTTLAPAPAQFTPVSPAAAPPQPPVMPVADLTSETERVKAQAGVGIKGRSLDQYQGPLVTPAKAYFSVRERVVFEIQLPEALKLYKATNDRPLQSFEELQAKVLEPNQIQLPELPPGQRYVWEPKTEELMVERPR